MEMTVYVNGKPEQRQVDHVEQASIRNISGRGHASGPGYLVPVLKSGEEVRYTLSGQCHIINLYKQSETLFQHGQDFYEMEIAAEVK